MIYDGTAIRTRYSIMSETVSLNSEKGLSVHSAVMMFLLKMKSKQMEHANLEI